MCAMLASKKQQQEMQMRNISISFFFFIIVKAFLAKAKDEFQVKYDKPSQVEYLLIFFSWKFSKIENLEYC